MSTGQFEWNAHFTCIKFVLILRMHFSCVHFTWLTFIHISVFIHLADAFIQSELSVSILTVYGILKKSVYVWASLNFSFGLFSTT